MNYNKTSLPIQKLPKSKKNEAWLKACIDYVIGMGSVVSGNTTRSRFEELSTYYNLYNSVFDERDLKTVVNPFKVDDGFPASPLNFNIIRPKVDLLIGEETKRPFAFKVVRTNEKATSELQEKTKLLVLNYVMSAMMANLSEEDRAKFLQLLESGEIMPPEQVANYMQRDYKDLLESTAFHTLNYLRQRLNLQHEFMKGWKDALIAGEEIYYVGIQNGEPSLERVNPLYFSFDRSPDLEFIEDGDWACRRMRFSYTEAYDRLYDKMTEQQLDKMLAMIDQKPGSAGIEKNMLDDFNHIRMRIVDNPTYDIRARNAVNVWHVCWKSFKKVAYVTYLDEQGEPQQDLVDEDYRVTGQELDITWDWILEIWEGYRIGSDLYVGCAPLEYQHISIDNPNSQKLPYCGAVYSNTNASPKSLVSIMKPLQYWYIVLWYRLELAMARDKGKVINMDITQIPKSMGVDVSKWLHYLTAVGVNFINPYEEGWNIPGREGGKPAQFNQITELDLTMTNVIAGYISLMDKIEQLAGELSGITPQRQGQVSSAELVGNVERSVMQSAHITEPLFWVHNQIKRRSMNMLLNTAKAAWSQSGKKKLHYIFDDAQRAFIDIVDEFYYEDQDVFVSDSTKDQANIEALKTLTQAAMQNGATLLEAAEVLTTDNLTQLKQTLGELDARKQQMIEQQQQAQAQQEQQLMAMQNEMKEAELNLREAELELTKYKIDQDNATKLAVAQISAYRGAEDMDQDNNGIPDPIELGNQALERYKVSAEIGDKQVQAALKERELRSKRDIEEKKIALEKQKLDAAEKLQRLKDSAAMEREKLKARTALKNKVSGEGKSKK